MIVEGKDNYYSQLTRSQKNIQRLATVTKWFGRSLKWGTTSDYKMSNGWAMDIQYIKLFKMTTKNACSGGDCMFYWRITKWICISKLFMLKTWSKKKILQTQFTLCFYSLGQMSMFKKVPYINGTFLNYWFLHRKLTRCLGCWCCWSVRSRSTKW